MLKLCKILMMAGVCWFSSAFAALELELTQGVDNAIPLAILPFMDEVVTNDSMTTVISNDLKNSGRFRLVNTSSSNNGEADFATWQKQKIEAVVTGQIKSIGNQKFLVTFRLFDVYNSKQLFEKEYALESKQLRKLSHHISDIIYYQWTGDRGVFSTKISYVLVERIGKINKYKLQVADSDGYNPRTLHTNLKFPLMSLAWSPDGREIAYVSFEGNRTAIYLQNVATGSRRILTKLPGINGAPAWSKDGKKIALVLTPTNGDPKIYIFDLATARMSRLTDGFSADTEPNWSPDGRSIIFTSDRGGHNLPQIYRVDVDSKKVERITFNGPYNARAAFNSTGNAIVMLHKEENLFTIALQDLKSGRTTLLTQPGLVNESPSIAPNGKMVVYATNYQGKGVLAEASIDGKVKLLLPAGDGEVREPAWSPFLN